MAEQDWELGSEDGLGAGAEAIEVMLRREAMDRLAAASGQDAPQPPDDDLLFDYLAGRLEEADEATVRDWLVADPEVARRLDEMQDWMAVDVAAKVSEDGVETVSWEARLAWKDLQDRLRSVRGSRRHAWTRSAWAGLAAAMLLTVGVGTGWWMGSTPRDAEPRAVQAITLQLLRDGAQSLPAGQALVLSMPLNVSQGSCDTLDWVLWRDGSERRRLVLTPQDGQLHLYVPPLEPGDYRVEIEDCHGGRQSLEVKVKE